MDAREKREYHFIDMESEADDPMMALVPVRLFADLAEWVDSEHVRGSFMVAHAHGYTVTPEYSANAQRMWDEVRELAKEVEHD